MEQQQPNAFEMFTVYANPVEAPGRYLVRQWTLPCGAIRAGPIRGPITANEETLERARQVGVPAGLVRLPRDPADDPSIVETWL